MNLSVKKMVNRCILCKSNEEDEVRYGEYLTKNDISVHTYCLYLTSNLVQNGDDNEGFYGFLLDDILKEVKRTAKLQCCYCRGNYAGIGCCKSSCSRSFHLICGLRNGALNQFSKSFLSFCHKHIPRDVIKEPPSSSKELCCICYNKLLTSKDKLHERRIHTILSPCCQNGWFHKVCLQRFALTAGYFFKCPLCNDTKMFRENLPFCGIYIPDRDAAWELEPNAFSELTERPTNCSAKKCYNKEGRLKNTEENPLIFCETCGSAAIHIKCWTNKYKNRQKKGLKQQYNCIECSGTLKKLNLKHTNIEDTLSCIKDCENENNEPIIDVCHISDNEKVDDDDELGNDIIRPRNRRFKNRLVSSTDSNSRASLDDYKNNRGACTSTDDDDDDKPILCKKRSKIKKSVMYMLTSDDEITSYSNDPTMDLENRESIIQVHICNDGIKTNVQENISSDKDSLNNFQFNVDMPKELKNNNITYFNLDKPTTSQNSNHKDRINGIMYKDEDFDSDSKPLSILKEEVKNQKITHQDNSVNQNCKAQETRKRNWISSNNNSEIPSPFLSYISKKPMNNSTTRSCYIKGHSKTSDDELPRSSYRRNFICQKSSRLNTLLQTSSDEEIFSNDKKINKKNKERRRIRSTNVCSGLLNYNGKPDAPVNTYYMSLRTRGTNGPNVVDNTASYNTSAATLRSRRGGQLVLPHKDVRECEIKYSTNKMQTISSCDEECENHTVKNRRQKRKIRCTSNSHNNSEESKRPCKAIYKTNSRKKRAITQRRKRRRPPSKNKN